MAAQLVDIGYAAARGESYSGLLFANAAAEGALFVARMNVKDVKRKIRGLHDPGYEKSWLARMGREIKELAALQQTLDGQVHRAREAYALGTKQKTTKRRTNR